MKKENKKTKKVSMDDLAIMIGRGFEDVNQRIDSLDKKIDDVEINLVYKINGLSNRIDDLSLNRVNREEHKKLEIRVDKIENKVFK